MNLAVVAYKPIRAVWIIVATAIFSTFNLNGQVKPSADSLDVLIQQCLNYLQAEQQKSTVADSNFRGEWPSYMQMKTRFVLLGGRTKVYDSNCFALAGMMNILSDVYRLDSNLTAIPEMLRLAYPQLISYRDSSGYNFWPLLKPNGKMLWKEDSIRTELLVRRPIQFQIHNTYIRRAANIMNDNDDTAQGMMAEWNYQTITNEKIDLFRTPQFDTFRDTLRENIHYYNHFARDPRSSGAFLTWRGAEYAFPTANLVKLLVNNALFLTPRSTAYPSAYEAYMPYGANDVDAIVNANVLSTLATLKLESKGTYGATQFIAQKVRREKWSRAGVYYPNRYQLHYAVIKAWKAGATSLSKCIDPIIEHLKSTQLLDGSFESRKIVNQRDKIQSTAYALHAMLKLGNPSKTGLEIQINKALGYLLFQAQKKEDKLFWEGGVYFSGGTVIRNTLYWKSDALTTAIILESLCLLKNYGLEKETKAEH
jgi:hypothetical protein